MIVDRNTRKLDIFRYIISIINGIIAGILGLSGIQGFIFYGAVTSIVVTFILVKMKFNTTKYFNFSNFHLFISTIFNFFITFVLLWTFSYAIIYLY